MAPRLSHPIHRILFLLACVAVAASGPCTAQEQQEAARPAYQSERMIGVVVNPVLANHYETGFGAGLRFIKYPRTRFLRFATGIQFWGATKDDNDIAVLGINESFTFVIPIGPATMLVCGITGEYRQTSKHRYIVTGTGTTRHRMESSSPEMASVIGFESGGPARRWMVEYRYGVTSEQHESMLAVGFAFPLSELRRKNGR